MILRINMGSDIPIYQQIRDEIVLKVAGGSMKSGDSLPTVRQLANDIGVNPMTVNKAYALLKEEGIVVIDRRHGAKISSSGMSGNAFDSDFDHRAGILISEVRMKGASKQDVKRYISGLVDIIYDK